MAFEPTETCRGARFLSKNDPVLAEVVRNVGAFTLKADPGGFEILVRSILSQQISMAAARTIRGRLQALLPAGKMTARNLDGTINFRRIAKESDENAVAELIQVKGIGRWTAQMYLMFSLGRIDVFAPDHLGLRNAIEKLYELPEKPSRSELEQLAEKWRPCRTIASWYLWRSLDQKVIADESPV